MASKKKIAIFASGSGTNAQRIMEYFQDHPSGEVALVVSGNPRAQVLERAQKFNIPTAVISKDELSDPEALEKHLKELGIELIVLAGFLKKIPDLLLKAFPYKIINIHPALLPKYGGKGMYGSRVHEAVKKAGETETGITIHYVNEEYDAGRVILQKKCSILPADTPEEIAKKVQKLEHKYFPQCIEELLI